MRRRNPHEQRVADALTRWYGLEGRLHAELAVPARCFRIDFVARVDEPAPAWGVLRPEVANREVLIEAYADRFTERDLVRVLIKLLGRLDTHWPKDRRGRRLERYEGRNASVEPGEECRAPRPPLMVVVCRRCAAHLLERDSIVRPYRLEAGLYRHLLGVPASVILVETDRLHAETGVALLRLLSIQRDVSKSGEVLDALERDRSYPKALREQVMRDIMNEQVETTNREAEDAYDRALRIGREEGRRGMLLEIARAIPGISAAEMRFLEGVEDADDLYARVTALLRP